MTASGNGKRAVQLLLPLDDTIDPATAARIARCSAETIRRWCEEQRVLAWKVVGRWRVDRRSIEQLIEGGRNIPRPEKSS